MRRIGILTSGGDCQALNATMRGVAKSYTICWMMWRSSDLKTDI